MDIWKVLEIEATRDKKAIKKAYRARLPFVNPEDDQEAFMELREAYEEALRLAELPDESEGSGTAEVDNSEAGIFRRELEALYWDFYRRIDTEEWRRLLACDFATALDTKKDAENIILTFMLEWYLVPCDVMRVLDNHFGLAENQNELFENYPEAFVQQAVLNAVNGNDSIPFDLFEVKDPKGMEDFFARYHKMREHIFHGDFGAAEKILREIDDSGVDHPYLDMRRAEIAAAAGDAEYGIETAAKMYEMFPEELDVLMFCGRMHQSCGNPADGRAFFEKVTAMVPDHADARFETAACLIEEGEYDKGKEVLIELSKDFPGSEAILEKLSEVGALIAEIIEEKEAAGQADNYDLFELADCYTDMERYEDAMSVLERMEIPFDKEVKSAMIHVVCLLSLQRYEEAAAIIPEYEDLLANHPEEDQKKYHTKLLYMKAGAFASLGRGDEERAVLKQIIEQVDPDFALAAAMLAKCSHEDGYYQAALEYAERAIEKDPKSFEGYFEAGRALYELGDSNGAISYLAKVREMEPYHLRTHMYMIKSLLDQNRADEAEDYLKYLTENGAKCLDMEFLRGRIEVVRGNKEEAAAIIRSVIEQAKSLPEAKRQDEIGNMGELYNSLANLEIRPGENFEEILALTEEGLEYEPGFGPLLQMKGNILYDLGEYHLALDEYKKISERYPEHNAIYWDMGCCYEMLAQLEDAYRCYLVQLERRPSVDCYSSCSRVSMNMGRMDLAESYLNKAIAHDDADPLVHLNFGRLMENKGQPDQALEYYAKARELSKTYRIKCRNAYRNAADILTKAQRGDEALDIIEDLYQQYGQAGDLLQIHLLTQIFGKPQLAMENLARWAAATHTSKESFEYQSKYAEILRLAGQPEKAAEICRRFIDEAPGACFFGGNLYYNMGRYEEALEIFLKGMEVCPEEKKNFLGAAKSAFRLGRREDAKKYAQAGLDTYPADRYAEPGPYFLQDEVVYGALLALTGDFSGGIGLVEKEMWGEMCRGCHYRECIDAYIELSDMYDFTGDKEKALEMARKGCLVSEFDFDLISERKRLEEELKC